MTGRWIARVAAVVALSLSAEAARAGSQSAQWTTSVRPGSEVHVTMSTHETFEAIWMGRDGDRGVFERFDPHETISVPLDSVQQVRVRKAPIFARRSGRGCAGRSGRRVGRVRANPSPLGST